MKNIFLFILLVVIQFASNTAITSTTLHIRERIRLLKKQVRNSLRNPSPHEDPAPAYYQSDENAPIVPILEHDELKKDDKFKLNRLKSPKTKALPLITFEFQKPRPNSDNLRTDSFLKPEKKRTRTTAIRNDFIPTIAPLNITEPSKLAFNIFYRRAYDPAVLDAAQPWMHCSEHMTPYLKGAKKEMNRPKKLQPNEYIVHRLVLLLKANTSSMTRAEKRTTMYQISKLRVRLYYWSAEAIQTLTATIARKLGRSMKIDFTAIKKGITKVLGAWQADLSNHTLLLHQAKVFRPPCIPRGEQGSSKLVRGSTLKPPEELKDDVEECRRRNGNDKCV